MGTPPSRRPPRGAQVVHVTVLMSKAPIERCRDAVAALEHTEHRTTLREIMDRGASDVVDQLSEMHNEGRPFPRRQRKLVGGRPSRARRRKVDDKGTKGGAR